MCQATPCELDESGCLVLRLVLAAWMTALWLFGEVSLNRTTSEDRFVQSGASRAMESTQSVERTQLISDDEFERPAWTW